MTADDADKLTELSCFTALIKSNSSTFNSRALYCYKQEHHEICCHTLD